MAGALGVVLTGNTVPVEGRHAIPVYVDDTLPIVGPSRACVVTTGEIPQAGGPPLAVRLAPAGTPAIGPAIPVYVIPGGGSLGADPTLAYTNKVIALGPIAYWPQAESSGTVIVDESGNGRNGAYTGVTLGNTGIGDGRTSAGYDGATTYGNIYSASLAAAFNGAELSVVIWGKVNAAGVWTDATSRRLFRLFVDANNYVEAYRTTVNGQLEIDYKAGGTVKGNTIASGSPAGLFHLAVTVSKAADQVKLYLNGAQSGATLTGLGVFAGALAAASCLIGASTQVPASVWSGTEAHMAVWARPLSAAEVLSTATL